MYTPGYVVRPSSYETRGVVSGKEFPLAGVKRSSNHFLMKAGGATEDNRGLYEKKNLSWGLRENQHGESQTRCMPLLKRRLRGGRGGTVGVAGVVGRVRMGDGPECEDRQT